MEEALQIISIAWICNLIVAFYVSRCLLHGLPLRKPFACEKCLGFWVGLIFFSFTQPIQLILIFASIVSLTSVTLRGIINKLNA